MYDTFDSTQICQELRNIIPTMMKQKDTIPKDTVFEGDSEQLLIFADYCYLQSKEEQNQAWEWESASGDPRDAQYASVTMNDIFTDIKIPLQNYIWHILDSLPNYHADMGCQIGIENRIFLVNEYDNVNPSHLGWHEDSCGLMPGDCWSTVTHYVISPSLKGGNIEFRGNSLVTYCPQENRGIAFEKDLEHRVVPMTSERGTSLRGSLQVFFEER
jgi:hypothetical protein